MGNHGALCYFVHMDFLAMLRAVADKALGKGNHGYGYAYDEVVTGDPDGTLALKGRMQRDEQFTPPDPNVQYEHPAAPHLRKASALEPVDNRSPAQRIIDQARAIRGQNAEIDKEVLREKARQKLKAQPPPKDDDGGIDI